MTGRAGARLARDFHDRTIHTPYSVRTSGHRLDWDVKPFPFKVYADAPAVPLPRDFDAIDTDTLAALGAAESPPPAPVALARLAALLYFSAGVTRKKTYPGGGEVLFRAAPSTGALYQTEVYAAVGAVEGLPPGLYHFCPGDFTLRRLRDRDVRAPLADAAADPTLARRAATIVLTAIYWRNTWKYQARGWRHLYWDSGTMLANLIAVARALGWAPRLVTGFVDAAVNRLLGLDPDHESVLELVAIGGETPPAPAVEIDEIHPDVMPLSASEVDYPELRAMQRVSMLDDAEAVRSWRGATPPPPRAPRGELSPLPPPRRQAGRSLAETIQHRGSSRRFTEASLAADELATILWWATRPVDGDVPAGLVDPYLIASAVDAVAPGAYRYWPDAHALELVRAGGFRRESAYLCLDQALGGDAAAVLYFLAPLDAVLAAYGDRGYRLVNLESGLVGGRAYLAAYAQRCGASGLTFYDTEAVSFFAPHADGLDAVFVTALGRGAR